MNDYSANFYHLNEGTLANKVVDSEEPAKYNPLYVAGRVAGYAAKRLKQGYDSSYNKQKATNEEASTPDGSANDGVAMGTGLGKPHDDGNHLYRIPINNYDDSDASFVGDGEEKETSQTNIPAILAAKQAGGMPDPKTVSNGINKRFKASLDPAMTDDNKNIQEGFLNSTAKKALKAARDLGHNVSAKHYGRLYNQKRKEFTSNGLGSKSGYSHMVRAGLDTLKQHKLKNPALYNSLKKS